MDEGFVTYISRDGYIVSANIKGYIHEFTVKLNPNDLLWRNIQNAAKTNDGLQDLLNQAIMLYRLIED